MKSKYLLKYHAFYAQRVNRLMDIVEKLFVSLPRDEYVSHPVVKLLARIRAADQQIIPTDPQRLEYKLKGALRKFCRYKKGLARYRLMFCFSNTPPIIAYLYLNDEFHLRQAGGKNDPYEEFVALVRKGIFSSDPKDPSLLAWLNKKT